VAADDLIVGLDIGTSKITAAIAEYDENDGLEIIGIGTAPSSGLRRGVVINIEATLRSVVDAIEAAEQMAAGRSSESSAVSPAVISRVSIPAALSR
jgi:cell division protein FtsA